MTFYGLISQAFNLCFISMNLTTSLAKFLVIDLDQTLIRGDLLKELTCELALKKPWLIPTIVIHAICGPLQLKKLVALHMRFNPSEVLYRDSVLDLIKSYKAEGAKVLLASASPDLWVKSIDAYLGLFDASIGSTNKNLKGKEKLNAILNFTKQQSFVYVGDSIDDYPIWQASAAAVAINPNSRTIKFLDSLVKLSQIKKVEYFYDQSPKLGNIFKALRLKQWLKNILLILPVLAAHRQLSFDLLIRLLVAFFAFSFSASTVYLLNDFLDRGADRKHPVKKFRPIASGDISVESLLLFSFTLLLVAIFLSVTVSVNLFFCIILYLALNKVYSL